MKPRRPDSAKSHLTKVTQDSEPSKKDLNASKFSETFSSGVSSIHEKADQFKQYVTEKDKDPRFKHLKSKLEVIQEKAYQPDSSKTSFKPFQRKKDRTTEKNSSKKIEEKQEKTQKEDEQLSLSRGFAEKNKQKMNSLKMATIQKKEEDEKAKETIKTKIKFDAFKVNKPGEKKELKKITPELKREESNKNVSEQREAVKKEQLSAEQKSQKQMKEEEQRKKAIRLNEYRNIQRYVNEMEARNILMFPRNYDQVVNNTSANLEELEKIDLNDFMDQPTEGDYEFLKAKINKMDHQLEESIDLESVIGHSQASQELQKEQNDNNSEIYASMSASDIRKRNAFMTQVFAGKISKQDIERMQEMDKTSMRMYKIQHEKQEEDVEFTEINMVKRQTNRVMERNRLEAVGQLYRDCDYLSEEHKKRLEELLNGDIGESPFEVNEIEAMQRKRIDQSIRMYREMAGSQDLSSDIFNEESLPKDPQNRKNAQQKILKERVANVNSRLAEVDKIVVTKAKIDNLMKKFQHTRTSSNYQLICEQNQQKYEAEMRTLAEAETMLQHLSHTQDVDSMIGEIQEKYRQLQQEIKRFNEMDAKELMRLQKQRLRGKLREVEEVQRQTEQIGPQIDHIQRIKQQIQEKLKAYDEMQQVEVPQLKCEGYKQQETLQDLDALITKKWQSQQANNQP